MDYQWLGSAGIKASSLCFGTMSFGGEADDVNARGGGEPVAPRHQPPGRAVPAPLGPGHAGGGDKAKALGVHPVSLAVAWVAAHPDATCPIVGARSPEQLGPYLDAPDFEMTPELRAEWRALSRTPPPATDRLEDQPGG